VTGFLQTVIGGLATGAVYALVAMGFSIVYRTMGLVNFAHADVVMIGAYVTVTFFLTAKLPFGVSLLAAVLLTGALGVVMERILRPLESKDLNLMLIGTIGFGIVLESLAILVWGSFGTAVPAPIPNRPLEFGGVIVTTYQLLILGVASLVTLLLFLFLDRTKLGTAMQAAAMDRLAATAMGVNVGSANAMAFAIGSAIAAGIPLLLEAPQPATVAELSLAHDPAFVGAVLVDEVEARVALGDDQGVVKLAGETQGRQ